MKIGLATPVAQLHLSYVRRLHQAHDTLHQSTFHNRQAASPFPTGCFVSQPLQYCLSFLISIHSSPPKDPPQRHFVAAVLVADRSHSRQGHWDSSRPAWRCSPELAVVQVVEEGAASLVERPHHTAGPGRAVS